MNQIVRLLAALVAVLAGAAAPAQTGSTPPPLRPGDYIAAVINQELVTAFELNQRMGLAREDARQPHALIQLEEIGRAHV